MFPVICEELRTNYLTLRLAATVPYACWLILYWGLQVMCRVLKGCFERGIFWRAKSCLKGIEDFHLEHWHWSLPANDRGEPTVCYKWTGWVWEITGWSQNCRKITDHCRGFYRIYPNLVWENRRMWTCNRLDLQTLGSQPVMPKNLPNLCSRHGLDFLKDSIWLNFNLHANRSVQVSHDSHNMFCFPHLMPLLPHHTI